MYYNDNPPPHFHAKYGENETVVAIETGEILAGWLPPRALGLVEEWRERHKAELLDDWRLAEQREPLVRIAPLE
ncbi:DUF4160 domain-containing protein [Natronospira sp.]|uniref:DUF4160 domain-containing protein n=1 Tax=Natronospira sp. TaxID=2024970 RepID=UPI0038738305